MADQPDKSEQTEDPTQKKLDDAHKKGDVAKSQEVTTWFMLIGSALLFAIMAPITGATLTRELKLVMENADRFDVSTNGFAQFVNMLMGTVLLTVLVPLAMMALFAIAANLIQHRPVWSLDPITPRLSKISPLAGFKRLFSTEALVNFAKGLAKIGIVGAAVFFAVWSERDQLDTLMTLDIHLILLDFQALGIKIFIAVIAIVTVIAVADFLYQRHKWWEKQKMTVKEVRDEHKNMEGDPQIKSRIRQIRAEKSRKRMMSQVPEASVIVTNPTHYAVALKYESDMAAPVCVAKGMDSLALRIRGVAKDHDIPIVENPPLARALYASVEVDDTIPAEHFKAVAQVIGFVMRLKNKAAWKA